MCPAAATACTLWLADSLCYLHTLLAAVKPGHKTCCCAVLFHVGVLQVLIGVLPRRSKLRAIVNQDQVRRS